VKDRLLLLLLIAAPAVGSPSREEFVVEQVMHQSQPIAERTQSKPIGKTYFSRVLPPRTKPSRIQHQTSRDWSCELVWAWLFMDVETANGEIFRKGTLTAAHRTLPFGTIVRVINLENGRSVNVRINDRGPFKYHRVIDLAHGAASELNMMHAGEINVRLEVLD
jgi:rare lipoprotein A